MREATAEQRAAIQARGNVLVVAGAGTGKTRTVIERCLGWLLADPTPASLEEILMVTFTEAAATEMRQRLREVLGQEVARHPGHTRLAEQLAWVDQALIGTLHSFCLRLVREHFYCLKLDPQVTVLPAEQATLLAEETLDRLLHRQYAEESPLALGVQELIYQQGQEWDQPVRELVLRKRDRCGGRACWRRDFGNGGTAGSQSCGTLSMKTSRPAARRWRPCPNRWIGARSPIV